VPTYGYRCEQCSLEFEVWQRMSDEPLAACPTCGGKGRRLFFPAGIVFKGTGFYKTDNRKGSTDGSSVTSSGSSSSPAPKEPTKGSAPTKSGTASESSG
jgi:putative FmdB family regulatory protein